MTTKKKTKPVDMQREAIDPMRDLSKAPVNQFPFKEQKKYSMTERVLCTLAYLGIVVFVVVVIIQWFAGGAV